MARFDDEQDMYTTRRRGARRDEYEDVQPTRETDRIRPAKASRQTDHVQTQRPLSASQRDAQRSQSSRSPRSPQPPRQRIEYERYGRIRPQTARETARRIERVDHVTRPFHTDENPDIPKIRRASLFQDNALLRPSRHVSTAQPTKKTAHMPIVEPEPDLEVDVEDVEDIEDADDIEDMNDIPLRRNYGARNVHVPSVPQQVYVRRGRHERTAYTQRTYSFLNVTRDILHNRPLLIFISCALVALVLLPLLINTLTRNAGSPSGTLSGMTGSQSGSGQQSLSGYPLDPRELVITSPDTTHPAPPVLAASAYLLDADTGATLYAYNPFMHLPMMSTTKLMTATLAIEHGNLDQRITINNAIANDLNQLSADSSVMGIKKGETYTLRELLYGLLLVSGNDAAIAIGDAIGGNLPNFVAMMNMRAQQLGLHDTHYMNPHGLLADNHYSSAHDLAILGRFSFAIPQIQQISDTRVYTILQTSDHAKHVLTNGNQFLWWYPGVNAGKPGWDGGSNFVQVISVVRNGHHLIGVTMHTSDWWTDMRDLMNWGFNSFQWVSPALSDKQSPIPYDNLWNYFADDKQSNTIPIANGGRYYVYTGYSISGSIMSYFDHHGGLNTFGYPTSLLSASGGNAVRQAFQRATIQCDIGSNQCGTV